MELINRTPYPAGLFRTVLDEKRFAAAVVARVTYDVAAGGLVPSAEQPWIVSMAPWKCEHGLMDGDAVFYRGGVDLFVFGHVRAPGGREATHVEVTIAVGGFRRRLVVFGDRVWQRRLLRLVPSPPKPFRAIPLTLTHAFGGITEWDGLAVPCTDNPEGKGFYYQEDLAVDQPLPNIEDPDHLIAKWDDRPEPAGVALCPMHLGVRLRNGMTYGANRQPVGIRPHLFNNAFPRMILERVQPGDPVRLTGVLETGEFAFTVPSTRLSVRLQFDEELTERPLVIDQLGIDVDKRRVFLAYRFPFRYVLHALQRRSCELLLQETSATPVQGPRP